MTGLTNSGRVYVGFPHIAQDQINKSGLNSTAMSIMNPKPDSFDLGLTSVLVTHSQYHPQLDAFNGSLFLEGSDTPFISFPVPATPGDNGAVSHVNMTVPIMHPDEWAEYTRVTLVNETVNLRLRGRGGLQEGSLPHTDVNYNTKVVVNGTSAEDQETDLRNKLLTVSVQGSTH